MKNQYRIVSENGVTRRCNYLCKSRTKGRHYEFSLIWIKKSDGKAGNAIESVINKTIYIINFQQMLLFSHQWAFVILWWWFEFKSSKSKVSRFSRENFSNFPPKLIKKFLHNWFIAFFWSFLYTFCLKLFKDIVIWYQKLQSWGAT